ncbi:hypothetical protein [Novosphingobium sp. KN65.2]|uniref:hypothetical protein n=1 Tax=Novosphingobium sp. KN65.2 TaxID=1478134 RepID=UPI0005E4F49E|nr:hypothetical protein [Novosphingobium sp. KN65.2]CDO35790.1 hypothetical protein SPHV1_2270136 [Novosphingobium sp. KN65.2]
MTYLAQKYTRRSFPGLSLRDAMICRTHWLKIDVRVRLRLYAFHPDNDRELRLWWNKSLRSPRERLLRKKRENLAAERAHERKYGPWPF